MNNKHISFFRHYHGYTGGHRKVRDYLDHFIALGWHPSLYLSNKAATNTELFSNISGVHYQDEYNPTKADVVFLAGMDWQFYLPLRQENQKVINLIQHIRHGDSAQALFKYLREPAIRLCVSNAVKDAIAPYANGPCHVVKMGHTLPYIKSDILWDIYILANKQASLGEELAEWARELGYRVNIDTQTTDSRKVHTAMASADVTIALPHATEGFYLPGIESMWLSKSAVVPYCVANKEYANRFANIYMPEYNKKAIQNATLNALHKNTCIKRIEKLIGNNIAASYSINEERRQLAAYLNTYFG